MGGRLGLREERAARSRPGSSVRNVPESLKDKAYTRYHIKRVAYAYEVDHLVSLELGGSNAITNLWPEHYYNPWGARTKDRLEGKLHALVCSGRLSLASAQRQESANCGRVPALADLRLADVEVRTRRQAVLRQDQGLQEVRRQGVRAWL